MLYHPFPRRLAENDVQNRPASPSQQLVPPQLQREEEKNSLLNDVNEMEELDFVRGASYGTWWLITI